MDHIFKLRHTTEHVLQQAVKELYPSIHLAMGPATHEGFYFDFDPHPKNRKAVKITEKDFPKIEKRMRQIIAKDLPIIKKELTEKEARKLFKDNPYKQEWIDQIVEAGDPITVYWTGEPDEEGSMVDLCKGPHVDSTGEIKAFKLLSVAGAYWHGDENNKMLTRIYGTAFPSREDLKEYMWLRKEAQKRDHKKLGVKLDLFTFSEKVGSGLPLWTPKGTLLRNLVDDYVWELRRERGYQQVEIPHITKKDLYQTSGHWDKFKEELFRIQTREGHEFAMKPMNCPHHTQIFDRKLHSYRELPQRYSNTTMVYRDEQTGELSGLSRVRSITQDDAHVFCRKSQIEQEMLTIWDIVDTFYKAVGFDLDVRLSLSDQNEPEKYLGDQQVWQEAEDILRSLSKKRGVEGYEAIGEAAFYGPKIDFIAKDALKREWQVATIQLDLNMPVRFGLVCTNEEGEKEQVYMLHAAIMGAIERFLSIVIEHFAGAFPVWLAPVQIVLLPVNQDHHQQCEQIASELVKNNIRTEIWPSTDSIGKRIRNAETQKVPFMAVVGDDEISSNTIALRSRGKLDLGSVSLDKVKEKINHLVDTKSLKLT